MCFLAFLCAVVFSFLISSFLSCVCCFLPLLRNTIFRPSFLPSYRMCFNFFLCFVYVCFSSVTPSYRMFSCLPPFHSIVDCLPSCLQIVSCYPFLLHAFLSCVLPPFLPPSLAFPVPSVLQTFLVLSLPPSLIVILRPFVPPSVPPSLPPSFLPSSLFCFLPSLHSFPCFNTQD